MYLKNSFVIVHWSELAECRVLSERVPKPASDSQLHLGEFHCAVVEQECPDISGAVRQEG
jgi:hypothetical protein